MLLRHLWFFCPNEVKWKSLSRVPLFVNPTDQMVHGILQARILEWVVFPFSRGSSQPRESSQPRDRTQAVRIAGGFFTSWATREARYKRYERQVSSVNSTAAWKRGACWSLTTAATAQFLWKLNLLMLWYIQCGLNPDQIQVRFLINKFYLFNEIYGQIKHIIQSISLQFPIINILHFFAAFVPNDQPMLIHSD